MPTIPVTCPCGAVTVCYHTRRIVAASPKRAAAFAAAAQRRVAALCPACSAPKENSPCASKAMKTSAAPKA